VYEYFITLDSEIKFIWGSRWGIMKILYMLTRYLQFSDTSLIIFSLLKLIVIWNRARYASYDMTVIFTLRTWVIWGKKRWLSYFLPVFCLCVWTCAYYSAGKAMDTVKCKSFSSGFARCLVTGGDITLIWINWTLLFFFDFGEKSSEHIYGLI
ncbi:hypothetical protein BDQ17DRAFT_1260149, partial [Cyathus striatus]